MDDDLFIIDSLGGQAPVQAEGTVRGYPFYFRARWDHWTFSISEKEDIDPVDVDSAVADAGLGFYREGRYGTGPYDASYMPEEEARRIIRTCVQEYLRERGLA